MVQGLSQPNNYELNIFDPAIATDVKPHWALRFIVKMCALKLMPLYSDNMFRPTEKITRGQLAIFFYRFSRLKDYPFFESDRFLNPVQIAFVRTSKPFSDIPADGLELALAAETAYRSGFMSGFPDGTFKPNDAVSRVQFLSSVASLCEGSEPLSAAYPKPSLLSESVISETISYYSDSASIPVWAKRATATASFMQAVAGFPTPRLLRPNDPLTRAELAAMFYSTFLAYVYYNKTVNSVYQYDNNGNPIPGSEKQEILISAIAPPGMEERPLHHDAIVNIWGNGGYRGSSPSTRNWCQFWG